MDRGRTRGGGKIPYPVTSFYIFLPCVLRKISFATQACTPNASTFYGAMTTQIDGGQWRLHG